MDPEDREFRRNQTDIEIWLKISLGCLTLAGSSVIAEAIHLASHSLDSFAILLAIFGLSTAGMAAYSIYQVEKFRKKLNEKEEPKEEAPKLQDQLMQKTKSE
jgi:hypothetical protein